MPPSNWYTSLKPRFFINADSTSQRIPPVQYVTTGLSFRWSYLPLSNSLMKSGVRRTSGTTASRNFPMRASNALRPSKNTTSSPRCSTSSCNAVGERCSPPPMTPEVSTFNSSGTPKVTISSRTRTLRRGKSLPSPSDHLKSMSLNAGYSRVTLMYRLIAAKLPPTVPLIPC